MARSVSILGSKTTHTNSVHNAVNEIDGGVGLAAAGGHLNQGTAFVGGEGALEVAGGFDRRGPEIGGGHLI